MECKCGGYALAGLKERLAAKEKIITDMLGLQASYAIFASGLGCKACKYEAKLLFLARASAQLQGQVALSLLNT